jgi:hypothetical protein
MSLGLYESKGAAIATMANAVNVASAATADEKWIFIADGG